MIKLESVNKSIFEGTSDFKRTLTFYLIGNDKELIEFNKAHNGYFEDEYLIIDTKYSHGNMSDIKENMKIKIKEFNNSLI